MLSESDLSTRLFKLFLENRALSLFESEIRQLLQICSTKDEFEVVWHSLSRMTIFDHAQLYQGLRAMALFAEGKAAQYGELAIVAMAFNSDADGSQLVLQMLKTELSRNYKFKLFNSVPSYVKKMSQYPNFMLIDDFSGTGRTILGRLKFIQKAAEEKKLSINSSVCLIAAMESAKNAIELAGHEITVFKDLKAGLSGYFSGDQLLHMKSNMVRLEQELKESIDGVKFPSFGYGQAEALYFLHPGNAPNSNFPIFWWPEDKNGGIRKTIMKRAEL